MFSLLLRFITIEISQINSHKLVRNDQEPFFLHLLLLLMSVCLKRYIGEEV